MAERYNYYENVKDDIRNELDYYDIEVDEDNIDEVYEEMYDNLWTSDSVTGNASGSYTFNTWQAEENIAHNLDLLQEALEEFGGDFDLRRGAEYFDVTIRCYLLGQALREVLEEMI